MKLAKNGARMKTNVQKCVGKQRWKYWNRQKYERGWESRVCVIESLDYC